VRTLAICLDGVQDEQLIAAAIPWTSLFESVELWCAYGKVAARELGYLRERHLRAAPHHHSEDVDRQQAQEILDRGAQLMRETRIEPRLRTLTGRDAGHALAEAGRGDVALFLAAGHRPGIGPHSVGHVARFVVDHAACAVIVVRLE